MNKLYKLVILLAFVLTGKSFSQICNPSGNLVIYSNYDGGIIYINCDVNIPNLKIGICTYEAAEIHIVGTFSNNVTGVIYAGFDGGNDNCMLGVTTTTIIGSSSQTINVYPSIGPYNPVHNNGNSNMVACDACDTLVYAGGSNTPDEVVFYFQFEFAGSSMRSHHTQYNCWSPTTFNISSGGNCCIIPPGLGPSCTAPPAPTNSSIQQTLCAGNSVTVGVTSTTTVFWYPTSTATSTLGSGLVFNTPTLSAGTHTFYAEAVNSCSASPRTPVTLTVQAVPVLTIAGTPSMCVGQAKTFTVSGANSYSWSTTQTASVITVSPSSTTLYTVTGTSASTGCKGTASISVNVMTCTALFSNDPAMDFSIFPNPAKNKLNVNTSAGKKKIQITDLAGKLLYETESEDMLVQIDISVLSKGIYLFTIHQNGIQQHARIMVE